MKLDFNHVNAEILYGLGKDYLSLVKVDIVILFKRVCNIL